MAVTVPARVGLAGNPSDGYGGATLAVPLPLLSATAEVVDTAGADDDLVRAACAVLHVEHVDVRWHTTIPRSVGLAGSSAVVVATIRAVAAHIGVDLEPMEVASLALRAERDVLGIPAGWQDRVVQAYGVPVLVDLESGAPVARVVRPARPLVLFAAWRAQDASPSQDAHGSLRERYERGDEGLVDAMVELASIARDAALGFERGDAEVLTRGIDATCEVRARIGALTAPTAELVAIARAHGAGATSAGSGGAVAGVAPHDDRALARAFAAVGAAYVTWTPKLHE